MSALVETFGLSRDYVSGGLVSGRRVSRALDDVTLTIGRGRIVGVAGESGCGKSTLARIVMALDRPTAGGLRFDGEDLLTMPTPALNRARRRFQMVFQDPFGSLDPRMRIARVVAEPLRLLVDAPDRAGRRARAAAALAEVGLEPIHLDRYPHELSGGQRQRVAIARALVTRPDLVVADEPVSALDLSVQAQVLNLLLDLRDRDGLTMLFISHNLAVIDCVSDDVAIMYRGRVVETGPARPTLARPLHPYTRLLVAAEPQLDAPRRDRRPPPATPAAQDPPISESGCAFAPRCAFRTRICLDARPALRDMGKHRASACHHAESLP